MSNVRDQTVYQHSLTQLTCGLNCTGISSFYSVEQQSNHSNQSNILSRSLINCGDSVQRFCGDNRIKLSRICNILITSLAPHNISGLPGVILCLSDLGVGNVTIVGPHGLQGIVDNMLPFVNRRYPEIEIVEIGGSNGRLSHKMDFGYFSVSVLGVRPAEAVDTVVAIACVLQPKLTATQSSTVGSDSASISCLPVASFRTIPSLDELVDWAVGQGSHFAQFIPLQAATGSDSAPAMRQRASRLCRSKGIAGIFTNCTTSGDVCELRRPQVTISLLGRLCPALFPKPLPGLLAEIQQQQQQQQQAKVTVTSHEKTLELHKEDIDMERIKVVKFLFQGEILDAVPNTYTDLIHVIISPVTVTVNNPSSEIEGSASCSSMGNNDKCLNCDLNSEESSDVDESDSSDDDEDDEEEEQYSDNKWNYCLRVISEKDVLQTLAERCLKEVNDVTSIPTPTGNGNGKGNEFIPVTPLCMDCSNTNSVDGYNASNVSTIDVQGSHMLPVVVQAMKSTVDTGTVIASSSNQTTASALKARLSASVGIKRSREVPDGAVVPNTTMTDSSTLSEMNPSDIASSHSEIPVAQTPTLILPPIPPPHPFDPKLTFLGTGSAAPSRHRCNSSVLLRLRTDSHFSEERLVMLDVGEGTASQMFLSVSGDEVRMSNHLRQLCLVWISHHHADHHCGLSMLLETRAKYRNRSKSSSSESWGKVVVVAPTNVLQYHEYCCCVAGLDEEVSFVSIDVFSKWNSGQIMAATGGSLFAFESVPVFHCKNAYGAVLHLTDRRMKVVYSGDCRPSDTLIRAGYGCDLLIHEATFDDSMSNDACAKKHCTTSEAVRVGQRMCARAIVLTHFSQRYPTMSQSCSYTAASTSTAMEFFQQFSVAFDFLHFSFPSQLPYLPVATDFIVSRILLSESNRRSAGDDEAL
eukprot:gene3609-7180_t